MGDHMTQRDTGEADRHLGHGRALSQQVLAPRASYLEPLPVSVNLRADLSPASSSSESLSPFFAAVQPSGKGLCIALAHAVHKRYVLLREGVLTAHCTQA